jgi:hypothetical protein
MTRKRIQINNMIEKGTRTFEKSGLAIDLISKRGAFRKKRNRRLTKLKIPIAIEELERKAISYLLNSIGLGSAIINKKS